MHRLPSNTAAPPSSAAIPSHTCRKNPFSLNTLDRPILSASAAPRLLFWTGCAESSSRRHSQEGTAVRRFLPALTVLTVLLAVAGAASAAPLPVDVVKDADKPTQSADIAWMLVST